MLNRNAKTLKVYSARITTSKQLYFANLLRISIFSKSAISMRLIQHLTLNIQHSTFNIQHSTYNIQFSLFLHIRLRSFNAFINYSYQLFRFFHNWS